jgi:uncharacterized protein (TIGR03083 family)
MDLDAHLSAIQSQGSALLRHARSAGLDAPVPTCPGWDARRLLQHVTRVWGRAEVIARTRSTTPPTSDQLPPFSPDDTVVGDAEAMLDRVVAALAEADPDVATYFFVPGAPGGSGSRTWARRMAHETAVHRADAEAADGHTPSPVDPHMAADGVDELVAVLLPGVVARLGVDLTTTVHLHCTDVEGEWMLDLRDGQLHVTREHGKGDLAVRGPASGLFLWSWNRLGTDDAGITTFGDPALLDAWRAIAL